MNELVLIDARRSENILDDRAEATERFPAGSAILGRDRLEKPIGSP